MKIGVTSEPILIITTILLAAVLFSGCTGKPANWQNSTTISYSDDSSNQQNQTTQMQQNQSSTQTNAGESMVYHNASNPIATFVTTKGTFKAEIFQDKAPISATNFLKLVKSGFYTNITFHRYVAGFVIQGGDPDGDGSGGSPDTISLEIVKELTHVKGSLGMARTMDPNSASSQFYVSLEDIHSLDGQYAVFGQVLEGMDVVLKLRQGDRMTNVTVN